MHTIITMYFTFFLLAALVAVATAQCAVDAQITIPTNTTQTIAQCRYVGLFGQQRCLIPTNGQLTFTMIGAQFLFNVDSKITDVAGNCYTVPDCGMGRCTECHAMQIQGCYNITSNDFTIYYNFTCYDASGCTANFGLTMDTYCGDGTCQVNEFCSTCPEDCCPSSTSTRSASSSPSQMPSIQSQPSIIVQTSASSSKPATSPSRSATASASQSGATTGQNNIAKSKNTQSAAAAILPVVMLVVVVIFW